jgi:hypothetical protein
MYCLVCTIYGFHGASEGFNRSGQPIIRPFEGLLILRERMQRLDYARWLLHSPVLVLGTQCPVRALCLMRAMLHFPYPAQNRVVGQFE